MSEPARKLNYKKSKDHTRRRSKNVQTQSEHKPATYPKQQGDLLAIDWTNRQRPPEREERAAARSQEPPPRPGSHNPDHIRLSWVAHCPDSDARRGSILFWLLQKIGRSD